MASMMFGITNEPTVAASIIATTLILFTASISFIVASGFMYLWKMSLETQEAPEVEKVSVQDMEAAASPIALKATITGAETKRVLTKFRSADSAAAMPAG